MLRIVIETNIIKIMPIAKEMLTSLWPIIACLSALTMYKIGLNQDIFCQGSGNIVIL